MLNLTVIDNRECFSVRNVNLVFEYTIDSRDVPMQVRIVIVNVRWEPTMFCRLHPTQFQQHSLAPDLFVQFPNCGLEARLGYS